MTQSFLPSQISADDRKDPHYEAHQHTAMRYGHTMCRPERQSLVVSPTHSPVDKKGGVKEEAVNLHPALGPSRRVTCSDNTHIYIGCGYMRSG